MAAAALGTRILKVNHAGEHGAINIYTGQIQMARYTAPDLIDELQTFRDHETRHRSIFLAELERRGSPRCRSYALCGLGGRVLGLITGVLGPQAIAATTVAVERVVLRHLAEQIHLLAGRDDAAVAAIQAIHDEEKLHHDQSQAHVAAGSIWYRMIAPVVAAATEAVIWLGMKL